MLVAFLYNFNILISYSCIFTSGLMFKINRFLLSSIGALVAVSKKIAKIINFFIAIAAKMNWIQRLIWLSKIFWNFYTLLALGCVFMCFDPKWWKNCCIPYKSFCFEQFLSKKTFESTAIIKVFVQFVVCCGWFANLRHHRWRS